MCKFRLNYRWDLNPPKTRLAAQICVKMMFCLPSWFGDPCLHPMDIQSSLSFC